MQDKKITIAQRKEEINDLELQLKNQRAEVDQVLQDKNAALKDVLEEISRLNERDVGSVATASEFSPLEANLLEILAMMIDKTDRTRRFDPENHGSYFLDVQELQALLRDRCEFEYNDACFRRLKEFIVRTQQTDFQKPPLMKCLYQFLAEMFRKLNVRNTMSQQYAQIAEIKASIDSNQFSINYSEYFIKERHTELQILEEKLKRVKQRDGQLSKKIEVAEISHMRTQHIFDSVKEYGQKASAKLERINARL